jgi:hypothetical protein
MKRNYLYLLAICFFSGCRRYYDWGKTFFVQADERKLNDAGIKQYHTYMTAHQGFETVGWFDILWMSDPVWDWYRSQLGQRYGMKENEVFDLQVEQDVETSSYITFYVLMSQPNVPTDPLKRLATNTPSQWAITLEVDGKEYQAKEIKQVDLAPELQQFFGFHYNRYRNVYRVKFARHNADQADLLDAEDMELKFRSVKHEIDFVWDHEEECWSIPQEEKSPLS